MKINKVTISAFRAFNKREDATFDFTVDGEKPADFISIYAPNGFGKTSLYDAIEWGITDSIERFNRNGSENSKSSVEERKKDKTKLWLRHNAADPHQEAFVEVLTDKERYYRPVPNTVYDFKKKGENLFFKNVILTQDAIDSFLREENSESRYQKFLESFPDLRKLDTVLNNVIKLLSANQDNIGFNDGALDKLSKIQMSLNFDGDDKILESINNEISKLISLGENLQTIERNASAETELKILDTRLSSRIFDLNSFLETTAEKISDLNQFFEGDESDPKRPGITGYYQRREFISTIQREVEQINKVLKKLELLGERHSLYSKQEKKFQDITSRKLYLQQFVPKIAGYKDSTERLEKLQEDTTKSNITIKEIQAEQNQIRLSELETAKRIINSAQSLSKVKEEILLYPSRLAMLNSNGEAVASIQKELKALNDDRQLLGTERAKIQEGIIRVEKLIDLCTSDAQQLLTEDLNMERRGLIEEFLECENKLVTNNSLISNLNEQLEKGRNLSTQITELISLGLDILSRDTGSSCPLCRHQYESYSSIIHQISGNTVLEQSEKSLLEQRQLLLTERQQISVDWQIRKEKVNESLLADKTFLVEKLEQFNIEDRGMETRFMFLNENLDQLRTEHNKNIPQQMLEDPEGYQQELFRDEIRLTDQVNGLEKISIRIKNDLDSLAVRLATETLKVENNIALSSSLANEEQFILVRNFIETNLIGQEDSAQELSGDLLQLEGQLNLIHEQLISLRASIAELEAELITAGSLPEERSKIEILQAQIEEQQRQLTPFEHLADVTYQLRLSNLGLNEAISEVDLLRRSLRNARESANKTLLIFQKISGMKAETFAYLESAKTAGEISILRKDNEQLAKVNSLLKQEKDSLTKFIGDEVKAFFKSDLINQIYFKMDPHPDYIGIEFECTFSATGKPRLELWVVDRDGGKSIPTLYFSAAQVNILSLSVFLARALTTKNDKGELVNCIFIDDPIQSMDSINILSIVDLFRSLVVSYGKQLIISTHEENFHNLLQKKVPKEYFNSKFLTLETFGKVASQ